MELNNTELNIISKIGPINQTIEEWLSNEVTSTDEYNNSGIQATYKYIEQWKNFKPSEPMSEAIKEEYKLLAINLDLDKYDKDIENKNLQLWDMEHTLIYASKLGIGNKPDNTSYFLGYKLLARMTLARYIFKQGADTSSINLLK